MVSSGGAPAHGQRSTNNFSRHEPPPYNGPQAQSPAEYAIIVYRPGAGHRFLSAFFVATFIWVLFGMLVQSSMYAMYGRGSWSRRLAIKGEYSIPTGIHLGQCTQGTAWKLFNPSKNDSDVDPDGWVWGAATYRLPVSSESLLLFSRGQNLVGSVELETSPRQPRDYAMVRILMTSSKGMALENTKACLVTRGVNETGVGILTPTTWRPGDFPGSNRSHFRITVVLPEFTYPFPLYIKNFETDVPGSAHIVQDLNTKVFFDKISLSGSAGFVTVKSLQANVVNISTTHSKITGRFNATKRVSLSTSNSPIVVDVDLTSREGSNSTFTAGTNSGDLHANINLFSSSPSGGSFSVTAKNSGGAVQIKLPTSPLGSELHLKALTSRAPVLVFLPPTYEGSFDLQTHYTKPIVNLDPDIEDPSGSGRRRRISYESVGEGAVSGYVDWGGSRGKGTVSVDSLTPHHLTGILLQG